MSSNVRNIITGEDTMAPATTKKSPRPRPTNAEVKQRVKEARKLFREDPNAPMKTVAGLVELAPATLAAHLKRKPRTNKEASKSGPGKGDLMALVRAVDDAKNAYHEAKAALFKYLDENKDLL
jgi:hypothetical protein